MNFDNLELRMHKLAGELSSNSGSISPEAPSKPPTESRNTASGGNQTLSTGPRRVDLNSRVDVDNRKGKKRPESKREKWM
jgi:hypothetical protein